ncbi:hypothetical protein HFP57_05245 [Parasphingopyxis algicola]|uniref:hypothetical protein n=1 Tax=Parasphingopyxis algicola TaxID=2026624 RepID=UPI0015A0E755|nr:hypothetical protein [Parasphingopyxis algicola]QLC24484.1 hypothetical protein HFP57_05245 [Parasphingopyxis algicola]
MRKLVFTFPIWFVILTSCTNLAGNGKVDYIGCYAVERSTIELTSNNEILVDGQFVAHFSAEELPGDVTIQSVPRVEFLIRDDRVVVQPEPNQVLLGAFNSLPNGTIGQFFSTGDDAGVFVAMKVSDDRCS